MPTNFLHPKLPGWRIYWQKQIHQCVEFAKNQTMQFNDPPDSGDVGGREDARLLVATAAGDQGSFAALYRRHGGLIYSVLVRMLVSEMEAQEVMQDTFVQIWERAHE